MIQVFARDNDINSALHVLKKKMQRDGTFREMKRRHAYEKPSERRAREPAEAAPPSQDASEPSGTRRVLIGSAMEYPSGHSLHSAAYYRQHAARVRALARDATTPAVKQHLYEVALEYERLAECVDESRASHTDSASAD